MKANTGLLPEWLKQLMVIGGLLLAIPGVLLTLGFLCTTFILVIENDPETVSVGLMGITVAALTFGAGGAVFWHSAAATSGTCPFTACVCLPG